MTRVSKSSNLHPDLTVYTVADIQWQTCELQKDRHWTSWLLTFNGWLHRNLGKRPVGSQSAWYFPINGWSIKQAKISSSCWYFAKNYDALAGFNLAAK